MSSAGTAARSSAEWRVKLVPPGEVLVQEAAGVVVATEREDRIRTHSYWWPAAIWARQAIPVSRSSRRPTQVSGHSVACRGDGVADVHGGVAADMCAWMV